MVVTDISTDEEGSVVILVDFVFIVEVDVHAVVTVVGNESVVTVVGNASVVTVVGNVYVVKVVGNASVVTVVGNSWLVLRFVFAVACVVTFVSD